MKAFLVSLMFLAVQQAPAGASLAGQVSALGTTQGLSDTKILLTRVGGVLRDSIVTTTDSSGRFFVANIPPGTYRVFADRDDYVRAEYGQRGWGQPGTQISVSAGQQLEDMRIILVQTGVITGHIVDSDVAMVSKVYVRALKYIYSQGERTTAVVQETQTNDLGEYRLFGLSPGNYLIRAAPYETPQIQNDRYVVPFPPGLDKGPESIVSASLAGILDGGAKLDPLVIARETYLPVYYPDTTELQSAKSLDLQPGAVLRGIDFRMITMPRSTGFRIRGQFMDGKTGQIAAGVRWELSETGAPSGFPRSGTSATGSFEISDVPPGHYVLSFGEAMTGKLAIEVSSGDLENIRGLVRVPIEISGRISGMPPALTGANIALQPRSGGAPAIRSDGTFVIQNIRAGDYHLFFLKGAPAQYYIKSAKIGETDVTSGFYIDATPSQPLTIIVSPSAGNLDGVVRDGNQRPAAPAVVVLIPDQPRRQYFELYRTAAADMSGHFHIEGIVPGKYRVFAWENVEENSWQVPEIIRKYEDQGTAVHIEEASKDVVSITIISSQ
jgi:hypothetical protein